MMVIALRHCCRPPIESHLSSLYHRSLGRCNLPEVAETGNGMAAVPAQYGVRPINAFPELAIGGKS